MIATYAISILEDVTEKEWEELYYIVSEERKIKINNYKFYNDKKRCLLAEIILMYALKHEFGLEKENINYIYNEYGKPLLNGNDTIFFNISHSGEWVVCIVGNVSVGIDVEAIVKIHENMYNYVLTKIEYQNIVCNVENREESFIKLWTLKESYVKALGVGISLPFNKIEFINDEQGKLIFINKNDRDLDYSFLSYKLDSRHMLAVCAKTDELFKSECAINYLTMKQLKQPLHFD